MRRLLSFTLVRLLAMAVIVGGVDVGMQAAMAWLAQGKGESAVIAILTAGFFGIAPVSLAAYWVCVRLIERRRPEELCGARAFPSFAGGVGIGLFLIAAVYLALWAIAAAQIQGWGSAARVAPILALSAGSACAEELVFRGVFFRIVEEGFGTFTALAVSAVVFGGLHAWNPGATPAGTAALALEAGVLLGLAYACSRTLWLPIGIHFGWNFTEGGVFGGAVSGFPAQGLIDIKLDGPDYLTGGAFGPEASVVTLAVCLLAASVMGVATIRRGEWRGFRLALRQPGGYAPQVVAVPLNQD